eukprot:COSAG02_NODE_43339_length_375_cov_6.188406_1_plen_38_part_10
MKTDLVGQIARQLVHVRDYMPSRPWRPPSPASVPPPPP